MSQQLLDSNMPRSKEPCKAPVRRTVVQKWPDIPLLKRRQLLETRTQIEQRYVYEIGSRKSRAFDTIPLSTVPGEGPMAGPCLSLSANRHRIPAGSASISNASQQHHSSLLNFLPPPQQPHDLLTDGDHGKHPQLPALPDNYMVPALLRRDSPSRPPGVWKTDLTVKNAPEGGALI